MRIRRCSKNNLFPHRRRWRNLRGHLRQRNKGSSPGPRRPIQQGKLAEASTHTHTRRLFSTSTRPPRLRRISRPRRFRSHGRTASPRCISRSPLPAYSRREDRIHRRRQHGWRCAADASIASQPGEIDRLVLLGASPNGSAEKIKSPILFIVVRNDTSGRRPPSSGNSKAIRESPATEELIVLDGSAHAQFLFQTDQADRVMKEILCFLTK